MRAAERKLLEDLIAKQGRRPNIAALNRKTPAQNDPQGVAAAQALLYDMGYGGAPSGKYDDETQQAVRKFARVRGNHANGHRITLALAKTLVAAHRDFEKEGGRERPVGEDAEEAGMSGSGLKPDVIGTLQELIDQSRVHAELRMESSLSYVASLQTMLFELGFGKPLSRGQFVSGSYDDPTRAAVEEFARQNALASDGTFVDTPLAKRLVARYRELESGPPEAPDRPDRPDPPDPPNPPNPPAPGDGSTAPGDLRVDGAGVTARLLGVTPVGQELENWCWAASTEMMVGYLRSLEETESATGGRTGSHHEDIAQGRQMNRRLEDSEVDCGVPRTDGFDYETCDRGGWPNSFFEFEDGVESTAWGARRHILEEHGLVLRDGGPRLRVRRPLTDWQLRRLTFGSGREFFRRLENAEGCALSWEMLTGLLDHQRPVAFTYRYPHPGVGHMRLAVGYAVTPGGRRWVAVADPLPPGQGEVHLIPYDYYVDGPSGGHWRDYWVLPDEETSPARLRRKSHELRVGKELVESYIEYYKDWLPAKPPTDGQGLSEDDLTEAFREAEKGFEAVKAIAMDAKTLAEKLGMGAAVARGMLDQRDTLGGSWRRIGLRMREVEADDLDLSEYDRIPIYELTARELRDWEPGGSPERRDILRLLDRPREILYAIRRPDLRPVSLFSAVTVRREKGGWKLASLGRAFLMRFLMGRQLGRATDRFFSGESPVGLDPLTAGVLAMARNVELYRDEATDALGGNPDTEQIENWIAPRLCDAFRENLKLDKNLTYSELMEKLNAWERKLRGKDPAQGRAKYRKKQLGDLQEKLDAAGASYPKQLWEERHQREEDRAAELELRRERAQKALEAESDPKERKRLSGEISATTVALKRTPTALRAEYETKMAEFGRLKEKLSTKAAAEERELSDDENMSLAKARRAVPSAGLWMFFWKSLQDPKLRSDIREGSVEELPGEIQLLLRRSWNNWGTGGTDRTHLLDLVKREEEIESLCAEWPPDDPTNEERQKKRQKMLVEIFEKTRDQEIAWISSRDLTHEMRAKLIEERGLDKGDPKPKYILSVPELYQLLVAYTPLDEGRITADPDLDDQVEPVYEKSFHRPERRVQKGRLREVLIDLKQVAHQREVLRGR